MLFLSEVARVLATGLLTLATVATGNTVLIQEGRVVEDDLYAAGGTVFIEGELEGDLVVIGSRVIVTGTVRGDVTAVAGSLSVFGDVEGSVRVATLGYNQDGDVGDDVFAVGRRAVVSGDTGGDALFYTWNAASRGSVGGQVLGEVINRLEIDGPVGSVDAGAFRMELGDGAITSGTVAHNPGVLANFLGMSSQVTVDPGASVGNVLDIPVASAPLVVRSAQWAFATLFFLATLFTGAVLIGTARGWVGRARERWTNLWAFPVGLATLALLPPLGFLLCLTVVLLPVGVMFLGLWVILVIGGAAPVLVDVGTRVLRRPESWVLGFLVAALAWRVIRFVPWIGPWVWLIVVCLGTGSLMLALPRRLFTDQ